MIYTQIESGDDPAGFVIGPSDPGPTTSTFTVTPSTTSAVEGNTVTWTISCSNAVGSTLHWKIDGATSADISDGVAQNSIYMDANTKTITKTIALDGVTEGAESFVFKLYSDPALSTLLATSAAVGVADAGTASPSTFPNKYGDFLSAKDSNRQWAVLNYGLEEAYRNNPTHTSKYTVNQFGIDLTSAVNQLKTAGKYVIIQTPNRVRQTGPGADYWGDTRDWRATITNYAQKCRDVAGATGVILHDKWNSTIWAAEGDQAWPQGSLEPTDKVYLALGRELGTLILNNSPKGPTTFQQIGTNLFRSYLNLGTNVSFVKRNAQPHNALEYRTTSPNQPFGDSITITWQQRLEAFYDGGTGGVAQLNVVLYFRNPSSGKLFAYIINTYDNRSGYLNYQPVASKNAEGTFFVSAPIGINRYMTSSNTHTTTAPDFVSTGGGLESNPLLSYSVTISKANFENALADLAPQGITGTSSQWILHGASVLHQIETFQNPDITCVTKVSFSTLRITSSSGASTSPSSVQLTPVVPGTFITNRRYDLNHGPTSPISPPVNSGWGTMSRWQGSDGVSPQTMFQNPYNDGDWDYFASRIDTALLQYSALPLTPSGAVDGGPSNTVEFLTDANNQPFTSNADDYLVINWSQEVRAEPTHYDTNSPGNTDAQINVYMYFKSKTSNKVFAILFNSYVTGSIAGNINYAPVIGQDSTGNTFFASTPVGNTKYCTSNNSQVHAAQSRTSYSVNFTRAQMQTVLNDYLNAPGLIPSPSLSTDDRKPENWQLTSAGILHETYIGNNPSRTIRNYVAFSTPKITVYSGQVASTALSPIDDVSQSTSDGVVTLQP